MSPNKPIDFEDIDIELKKQKDI